MAKQLDPKIAEVLKAFGFTATACWDCHGTWVVYHRVLEQIGVKAGIAFDPPVVLEADGTRKAVALCVTGHMNGGASQWSIGEASEHNYRTKGNQAAYPYAMAEKRAKDRVILKLIGLHGLAYSEDEADDFKPAMERTDPRHDPDVYVTWALGQIEDLPTKDDVATWWKGETDARRDHSLTQEHVDNLKAAMLKRFPREQKAA